MNFLPVSIAAYALTAGSVIADKILLNKALPSPLTYTFYVNVLQLLVIFLIPFGFILPTGLPLYLAIASGITLVLALYTFFTSLKLTEASLAGPLVGAFNPFFALIFEVFLLHQPLSSTQQLAVLVLIIGTIILTATQWAKKIQANQTLLWIIASGFLFGLSYVLLRQAYLETTFLNGLIVSRVTAGLVALSLLFLPFLRKQVFTRRHSSPISSRSTLILLIVGQTMGASSGLLLAYGVALASASLVNALFGIQYLVILVISLLLYKNHPELLEERLSPSVIVQKLLGVIIISAGLYLLAKQ